MLHDVCPDEGVLKGSGELILWENLFAGVSGYKREKRSFPGASYAIFGVAWTGWNFLDGGI